MITCHPMTGVLSLSVTVFGVVSKTGQQQLAALQSTALLRGSEAFGSAGWSAPRKIPPSLSRPAWPGYTVTYYMVIIIIIIIISMEGEPIQAGVASQAVVFTLSWDRHADTEIDFQSMRMTE